MGRQSTDITDAVSVPPVAKWFQDGFHRFLRPFLRRHFHAIAIERQSRIASADVAGLPVIVYGNHPSWWDPLIAHYLNRQLLPERQFYAPIDDDALQQYRVFGRLGFYGVRMDRASGAATFLKQSLAILGHGETAIWLTPEGRFADARDHTAELMPGLAHLCTRLSAAAIIPLALEYIFWEERLPVCLAKTGTPILLTEQSGLSKPQWAELLSDRLRQTQSDLSQLAIARSAAPFDNLLSGHRGAGTVYDSFRRVKAWVTGQPFRAQHGEHFE